MKLRDIHRPHLAAVPVPAEQRGGEVIEKLRDLLLRTRTSAKRELLADLSEHYMQSPHKVLSAWQVAEYLLARAVELEGGDVA